jgi:hypothetical protein
MSSEPATIDDLEYYSDADVAALEACIEVTKAESEGRRLQVESMLADDWEDAALFCCYCAQYRSLNLQVHQYPPVWAHEDDSDDGPNNCDQRDARSLLREMLAAGVSRFDPNPREALRRAQAHKRKRKPAL